MVKPGDEVQPKELSHMRTVIEESNQARQEAERRGELSIGYVYGCADCWRVVDAFDADQHDPTACPLCGSTEIIGGTK